MEILWAVQKLYSEHDLKLIYNIWYFKIRQPVKKL